MRLSDLRRYSPLTYGLERLFFALQYLSPANLLFRTRIATQLDFSDAKNTEELTIKRGRRIEAYVVAWLFVLLVCASFASTATGCVWFLVVALPMFRVFEILQGAINMNIFDRLRMEDRKHYVSGVARTIVLSLWNFVELLFCFGIVYSSMLHNLKNAETWSDAYYFSVVTQLTIGYGDISPLGIVKLLAPLQGLIGFLFALFVLSRFIAFLPRTEAVQRDD